MRKYSIFALLTVSLVVSSNCAAQEIYVSPEYIRWQESIPVIGLVEDGWRIAIGARKSRNDIVSGLLFAYDIRLYGGINDYSGALQTPSGLIPHKTKTSYIGFLSEIGVGYRWELDNGCFLAMVGSFFVDFWRRRIQGEGGYDEFWATFPLRLGIRLDSPPDKGWLVGGSLKLPVFNVEHVNISGWGSVTLRPSMRVCGDAEFGYRFNNWFSLIAFFESYWFGKSSIVSPGIYQPESKMYIIGLRNAFNF